MSTIKKDSIWIFKPHRTVLINNKTTKHHYLFFYCIYGLLPFSSCCRSNLSFISLAFVICFIRGDMELLLAHKGFKPFRLWGLFAWLSLCWSANFLAELAFEPTLPPPNPPPKPPSSAWLLLLSCLDSNSFLNSSSCSLVYSYFLLGLKQTRNPR